MARKLRMEFPGAVYHVMFRGDHQKIGVKPWLPEDRLRFRAFESGEGEVAGEGGADHRGGTQAGGMERGGVGGAAQKRSV